MQLIRSRDDNAKIKSSTTNTPEQPLILRFRDSQNFPVRGDDTSRNQGIDFQAEYAGITPNTTTESYANETRTGDRPALYFMSVHELIGG